MDLKDRQVQLAQTRRSQSQTGAAKTKQKKEVVEGQESGKLFWARPVETLHNQGSGPVNQARQLMAFQGLQQQQQQKHCVFKNRPWTTELPN